jgi:hypothetical protein
MVAYLIAKPKRSFLTHRQCGSALERGRSIALADGSVAWLTAHPRYLLRLDGAARERERFAQDLAGFAALRG